MGKNIDLISKKIEKKIDNSGFKPKKSNNSEIIFSNEAISYSICYNEEKRTFELKLCNDSSVDSSSSWKKISEWLFDYNSSSDRDAETIANDFAESIVGSKNKKQPQEKKNKDKNKDSEKNIDLNFFMNRLVNFFPEIKDDFKLEKDNKYENFRYVNFTENVVLPKIKNLFQDKGKKGRIKKFANLLDNMYSSGNLDVRGVITIIILRSVEEEQNRKSLEIYMSEELQKAWKASDKLKGKVIKPEKIKNKKKYNLKYTADTLKK